MVGIDMEQRLAVLQPHLFEGVPLPAVAKRAGVPLRTARGGWRRTGLVAPTD